MAKLYRSLALTGTGPSFTLGSEAEDDLRSLLFIDVENTSLLQIDPICQHAYGRVVYAFLLLNTFEDRSLGL